MKKITIKEPYITGTEPNYWQKFYKLISESTNISIDELNQLSG